MKELFDFLVRNKITPNGWLVLWGIHSRIMYPNYVNVTTEHTRLTLTGFLEKITNKKTGLNDYQLTDKGKHLLRDAENLTQRLKRAKKNAVPFAEWEEKIAMYVSIFPRGKTGGVPVRSSPKELYDRFVWFFSQYPEFEWEHVYEATRAYIQGKEEDPEGMKYLSTSKYFIKKQDKTGTINSPLADWCYAAREGELEDMQQGGKQYFGVDIV